MIELPLAGYVDALSARPGETLNFKVSSRSEAPFTVNLWRSICADPNPAGPGILEQNAAEYFPSQSFPSRHQPFYPGSYGLAEAAVSTPAGCDVVVCAIVYPTLRCDRPQTILHVGDYELYLNTDGVACARIGLLNIAGGSALQLRAWTSIRARVSAGTLTLETQPVNRSGQSSVATSELIAPPALQGRPCIAARMRGQIALQHFNGKIEAPSIVINGETLCAWDFSRGMSNTSVPGIAGPALQLSNFPSRAMTSSAWDGSEMNWSHKPEHYAAIHFHDDDIYDFGWDTDFSFTVPDAMPSGVYVMRLACGSEADAIPFFVKPPLGQARARLCVLVSTFTYSIYGNHARPDYHPSWAERITAWDAYPHNPAEYPQYGLSTYNYHSDGAGICHASHRRPLFNLRPGYITFGQASCSGLRHLQADSHLLSWLHAKNIDYDIVTDQDLHEHGHAAIAHYTTVTTGSHPEYHTTQTLDALRTYRDNGGHLLYLGGNGFYWRIAVHPDNDSVLEIRRAEDGIRAWAAEPGEYYNAFDGQYGGLWRRNGRAPQALVGVGFAAQGEFVGDPYRRVCTDAAYDWAFAGIDDDIIGDFGLSGNGAAGFELDHMDHRIGTPDNAVLLARSVTRDSEFMLVPEEQLTHLTNLSGGPEADVKHADMVFIEYPGGGSVFSTGSITFCGSLPTNNFNNNVSQLLLNVIERHLGRPGS